LGFEGLNTLCSYFLPLMIVMMIGCGAMGVD